MRLAGPLQAAMTLKRKKVAILHTPGRRLEARCNKRIPRNAEIFVNLGDAIRKEKPGEGGGQAFQNYQKAAEVNPNFAVSYYRTAQLFQTQRNWELYEKYLNDAVAKDPRFAPLIMTFIILNCSGRTLPTQNNTQKNTSKSTDADPQND
jgi:tetratricopeptide (TPR) repeat protein